MPRKPNSFPKDETILSWIEPHVDLMYESTKQSIYCSKCEVTIGCTSKNVVKKHVKSGKHRGLQQKKEDFYFDLVQFLILCNIPWQQIENPAFKSFFEKYICCKCGDSPKLPGESIIRRTYLDKFYKEKLSVIHGDVADEKLWISLDETTDFLGRYIVHFLVKPLNSDASKKTYLIACKMLEIVNGESISNFVVECLKQLWGESYKNKLENIILLSTDSVAYMLKAGRILKNVFPKLKHVTCLAHALHRVAEQIRFQYPDVDSLIANIKKVFLKSPSRVRILKEKYPNMPLPPQPVITRWGTWLSAVSYYVKYFNEINLVLSCLRSSEAASIKKAKNILNKPNIKTDLDYIDEHFKIIEIALKRLQERDISIIDAFEIFDEVRTVINWSSSLPIQNKMEAVMARNPDLDELRVYAQQILSETASDETFLYKFAPLTSVEVERSFSAYKWILDVKRNRLKIDNIEKIMIIYFNFIQTEH